MEIGDEIILNVEDITASSQGVGNFNGLKIFVDNALPGERIKAKILSIKKNYIIAEINEIIEKSPFRVDPVCSHFEKCGACQFLHINYDAQLKIKTKIVKDALKKISGFGQDLVKDIVKSPKQFGYRNKMQYPLKKIKGKICLGYYRKKSHQIIDILNCCVLPETLNLIASSLRKALNELNFSIYDEDTQKGLLRHLLGRYAFATGESAITFVINDKIFHGSNRLIDTFFSNLDSSIKIKNISYNINLRKTNVILGNVTKVIVGNEYIYEFLGKLKFAISPASFFQINPFQAKNVFDKVCEHCKNFGRATIFDLYCGVGTISLWVSDFAERVFGIEEIESAISDAKKNAKLNNKRNVYFRVGTVEKQLQKIILTKNNPSIVVLDPPRSGCSREVITKVFDFLPDRIVYVSCDPATLARDIKILSIKYDLKEVQPFDMFPQTGHIECVALLDKKN